MSVSRSVRRSSTTLLFTGVLAAASLGTTALAQASSATPAPARTTTSTQAPARLTGSAKPDTRCPSGWFCVWPQANFGGSWVGGQSHSTCYTPFSGGHSVSNQSGVTIVVYSGKGCTGSYFDLSSGYYSNPTPYAVYSVKTD